LEIGDNPVDGVVQVLPKQSELKGHHKALAHSGVSEFIKRLRASNQTHFTKLAFEFLILTAVRTSEILGATWEEVDLENATWTIPASRMKASREHQVPLSPRAMEILPVARGMANGSELIFPGRHSSRPLSNMVFAMALRRMNVDATPHGFRSTFRDWAAEETNFPAEVCEMALAHTIRNKTEAAYLRTNLFLKRRDLMEQWSRYCSEEAKI
jgi:integrase